MLIAIDMEKHVVADGGRDQGTGVFLPPLRAFLTTLQQQLKDEFFSNLEAEKSKRDNPEAKDDDVKEDGTTREPTVKLKAKPKLQLKKKTDDDPFASDDEEEERPKAKTSKPLLKATSKPPSKSSGEPPSKVRVSAKKPPSKVGTAAKRIREESESDEEVKPKRRVLLKSKE